MSRVMTQEERFRRMVETPVSKLIPSLAVPTIISMLITSIYNMADTYFVSQINTSASAAVGVSYSLMSMIQAFGFTLGMGGGNYLSRVLGTQDTKKAEQIASTAFYTSMAVGAVLAVLGLVVSGSSGTDPRRYGYHRSLREGLRQIYFDGGSHYDGRPFYE